MAWECGFVIVVVFVGLVDVLLRKNNWFREGLNNVKLVACRKRKTKLKELEDEKLGVNPNVCS